MKTTFLGFWLSITMKTTFIVLERIQSIEPYIYMNLALVGTKEILNRRRDRVSVHFAVTFLDCWRTSFCVTTITKAADLISSLHRGGAVVLLPPLGIPGGGLPPKGFLGKGKTQVFWVKKRACPHHQRGVSPLKSIVENFLSAIYFQNLP